MASIALPPSLFDRITDREEVGIFFALYDDNTLFPVREDARLAGTSSVAHIVVGSPVVASTVGPRLSFNNLQTPVEINLRLMSSPDTVRNNELVPLVILM